MKHVRGTKTIILFTAFLCVLSHGCSAQMSSAPSGQAGAPTAPLHLPGDEGQRHPFPPDMEEKALRMRNEQRQKQLVSDAGKLLALAHQLQVEVNSASAGALPQRTLKKAEEVEKLARSVKDKMKAD